MPIKDRNTVMAILGSLIIIAGVMFAYNSYFYGPIAKEIKQKQVEVADLKQKLQVAMERAQQLGKMQQEMASLQVDVAQLEKQLPKDRELPALIRVLTHRAESYGITLGNIQPGKPISKGLYEEIPYVMSVTASFHGLGHFLESLGK